MPTTHQALLPPNQVPPTPLMPTMSITAKGVLHLHASLREKLALREQQPIDLIPPYAGRPYWYLDLRPCAGRRIDWALNTRPKVRGILLPAGLEPVMNLQRVGQA